MSNPRVFITGATDGIGLETALELARRGLEVVLHGRSDARLEAARSRVAAIATAPVHTSKADLASLAEVRRLGDETARRFDVIDVLVHNAGIYANDPTLTVDGFESTFAVNHLAPFLLTARLTPSLARSPHPRVVNVSSIAHARGRIDPSTFRSLEGYDAYRAYAASKLCNVLFTLELQRRHPEWAVNALHPGVVSTKLLTDGFGMSGPDSLAEGARTSVWLAASDEAASLRGTYCVRARPATASAPARDPELARRLWALTEEAVAPFSA